MGLINLTQHTLERIIKNTRDRIQDVTPFVGTQSEWNALSVSEKAKYKIVHLTGNGTYKRDATTGDLVSIAGSGGSSSPMTGATANADGTAGTVPQPLAGDQDKVLQGDGTWGHKLVIDIVENNGVYGYMNGNTFVPFKSQADIDAAVTAARVGNATAADVKSDKTFTNASGSGLVGTFASQEKTVTAGTSAASVTPDSGKWLSKVTYNPTPSQEKSTTPTTRSATAATITPDSGKLLSKVTVNTNSVPNTNSGTYTASSRSDSIDMGATNTYRYVKTSGVPNSNSGTYTPSSNGSALDMGATNTYRYVNTNTVYNLGVSAAKANLEHVTSITISMDDSNFGFIVKGLTKNETYISIVETTSVSGSSLRNNASVLNANLIEASDWTTVSSSYRVCIFIYKATNTNVTLLPRKRATGGSVGTYRLYTST